MINEVAARWYQGAEAQEKIKALLKQQSLCIEDVQSQAFMLRLTEIEKIDRMLASLERRRDQVLREMELHREFARRLQERATAHGGQASLA